MAFFSHCIGNFFKRRVKWQLWFKQDKTGLGQATVQSCYQLLYYPNVKRKLFNMMSVYKTWKQLFFIKTVYRWAKFFFWNPFFTLQYCFTRTQKNDTMNIVKNAEKCNRISSLVLTVAFTTNTLQMNKVISAWSITESKDKSWLYSSHRVRADYIHRGDKGWAYACTQKLLVLFLYCLAEVFAVHFSPSTESNITLSSFFIVAFI